MVSILAVSPSAAVLGALLALQQKDASVEVTVSSLEDAPRLLVAECAELSPIWKQRNVVAEKPYFRAHGKGSRWM